MDSIDAFRSELQQAGKAWVELVKPELQALRKEIVSDITTELRNSSRKKLRRRADPGKEAIAKLIQENPKITNWEICRAMDNLAQRSPYYTPPPSWDCRGRS